MATCQRCRGSWRKVVESCIKTKVVFDQSALCCFLVFGLPFVLTLLLHDFGKHKISVSNTNIKEVRQLHFVHRGKKVVYTSTRKLVGILFKFVLLAQRCRPHGGTRYSTNQTTQNMLYAQDLLQYSSPQSLSTVFPLNMDGFTYVVGTFSAGALSLVILFACVVSKGTRKQNWLLLMLYSAPQRHLQRTYTTNVSKFSRIKFLM